MAWRCSFRAGDHRNRFPIYLVEHPRLGCHLSHLPVIRERWPDVLRVRLGIHSPRGLFLRDVSRRRAPCAPADPDLAVSVAAVPNHVRRWPDQVEGRSVLARPYLSELLLRN